MGSSWRRSTTSTAGQPRRSSARLGTRSVAPAEGFERRARRHQRGTARRPARPARRRRRGRARSGPARPGSASSCSSSTTTRPRPGHRRPGAGPGADHGHPAGRRPGPLAGGRRAGPVVGEAGDRWPDRAQAGRQPLRLGHRRAQHERVAVRVGGGREHQRVPVGAGRPAAAPLAGGAGRRSGAGRRAASADGPAPTADRAGPAPRPAATRCAGTRPGRPAQRHAAQRARSTRSAGGPQPVTLASGRRSTPSRRLDVDVDDPAADPPAVQLDPHHRPDADAVVPSRRGRGSRTPCRCRPVGQDPDDHAGRAGAVRARAAELQVVDPGGLLPGEVGVVPAEVAVGRGLR